MDPKHKKTVYNYISLIASESPSLALAELLELEKVNPNFSPLEAQLGIVLADIGDYPAAITHLSRAIKISPEVANYRYNLAIIYDRVGSYNNAIALYQQALNLSDSGASLPQSNEYIKARINYLQNLMVKMKEGK